MKKMINIVQVVHNFTPEMAGHALFQDILHGSILIIRHETQRKDSFGTGGTKGI